MVSCKNKGYKNGNYFVVHYLNKEHEVTYKLSNLPEGF